MRLDGPQAARTTRSEIPPHVKRRSERIMCRPQAGGWSLDRHRGPGAPSMAIGQMCHAPNLCAKHGRVTSCRKRS